MAALFEISIDAHEVIDLAAAWKQAPDIVVDELFKLTLEAELFLEREAKERTPTATGVTRSSISAREPKRLAAQVIGEVGTSLAHAVPLELGSRPHFPPVQALIDWARVKFGVPPEMAEEIGWGVARKIAAEGTEGAHMFQRAFDAGQAQVAAIAQRGLQRITARLVEAAP